MTDVLLYDSARTRVVRRTGADGAATIRKEYHGPGAAGRRRHELTILRRLAGLHGVPVLAPGNDGDGEAALVLADAGGDELAAELETRTFDIPALLHFAVELAGVVAGVHHRGVVDKDINPANIIMVGAQVLLVDFGLAGTSAEERPGFTHLKEILGTLPYLAPEQTGRTGWPVDQRADLYGLGSTLYELATGEPPFGCGSDPLELTHDQLTRTPVPPSHRRTAILWFWLRSRLSSATCWRSNPIAATRAPKDSCTTSAGSATGTWPASSPNSGTSRGASPRPAAWSAGPPRSRCCRSASVSRSPAVAPALSSPVNPAWARPGSLTNCAAA